MPVRRSSGEKRRVRSVGCGERAAKQPHTHRHDERASQSHKETAGNEGSEIRACHRCGHSARSGPERRTDVDQAAPPVRQAPD